MVKTMLPVQRIKDEYEFHESSILPMQPVSPMEIEDFENVGAVQCSDSEIARPEDFVEMKEHLADNWRRLFRDKDILQLVHNFHYLYLVHRVYQDKLAGFKKQLQQLKEGTHPEYNKKLKKLELSYKERLRLNAIGREHLCHMVDKEYASEQKAIAKEFEEKKIELKDNLIADLEEKRRNIENHKSSIDISGDQAEPKPVMTRKLRRRPNDPLPVPDKRRKNPPTQLNYLLDDRDIDEDLREINSARFNKKGKYCSGSSLSDKPLIDCRMEDGKLMYEKKWLLRGQTVIIEGRSIPKFPAVICSIKTEALWVKKTDGSKFRINLSQLVKGKILLKKKS